MRKIAFYQPKSHLMKSLIVFGLSYLRHMPGGIVSTPFNAQLDTTVNNQYSNKTYIDSVIYSVEREKSRSHILLCNLC